MKRANRQPSTVRRVVCWLLPLALAACSGDGPDKDQVTVGMAREDVEEIFGPGKLGPAMPLCEACAGPVEQVFYPLERQHWFEPTPKKLLVCYQQGTVCARVAVRL